MRKELTNPKNLILDSIKFIENNYENYNFYIVSGSDQEELRFLCKELNIEKYFKSIYGSPTKKNILVKNVINFNNHKIEEKYEVLISARMAGKTLVWYLENFAPKNTPKS